MKKKDDTYYWLGEVWEFIAPILLFILGVLLSPFIAYAFLWFVAYSFHFIDQLFS